MLFVPWHHISLYWGEHWVTDSGGIWEGGKNRTGNFLTPASALDMLESQDPSIRRPGPARYYWVCDLSRCTVRQRKSQKNTIGLYCWISHSRTILNGIHVAVEYNGTNHKLTIILLWPCATMYHKPSDVLTRHTRTPIMTIGPTANRPQWSVNEHDILKNLILCVTYLLITWDYLFLIAPKLHICLEFVYITGDNDYL